MEVLAVRGLVKPPSELSNMGSIEWRGHGGGKPTLQTVDFDQQLDKIAIWLEQWDHEQVLANN